MLSKLDKKERGKIPPVEEMTRNLYPKRHWMEKAAEKLKATREAKRLAALDILKRRMKEKHGGA